MYCSKISAPAAWIFSCGFMSIIFGTAGQFRVICDLRLTAALLKKELKFRLISWLFTRAARLLRKHKASFMLLKTKESNYAFE